jgi:acyl transferase domain-containing protein/thioesterase domain-containing protein
MPDDDLDAPRDDDVAVVGLACRFPSARGPEAFWANLRAGIESVRTLTVDELRAGGVSESVIADPRYVRASVPLEEHDRFDAAFFGFSPLDASIMDPQHRVFLECAWEALEHAGHVPDRFEGNIGVYAGCGPNTYWAQHLLTNADLVERVGPFLLRHTGNDKDFLATRVSYCFDLRGPSVSVQTACSTSLVAVHLAVQSLQLGESDLVLAGGVTIDLPQGVGYRYEEGEVLSPDGHCRAFDAQGQGTIFGSGAGVVALRRLGDARRDGDTVYAVLRGSAVNNDGARKVGYLAPSVDGQVACVTEALAVSGIDASTIAYIEAHGTGTNVGDPIEVTALADAFGADAGGPGSILLGSTKPSIGHLDTAAGVASLIKVVLALHHRELPASLNFSEPNPLIEWDAAPFAVNAALTPFEPRAGAPRRAGVNSLGVGGTNAFVVVEEAPEPDDRGPIDASERPWSLALSARTPQALDRAATELGAWLAEHPDADLGDVTFTLREGRRAHKHRRVVVGDDVPSIALALTGSDAQVTASVDALDGTPWVAYLLPGGGAQHPGMAADLAAAEPAFRAAVDACLACLDPDDAATLRRLLLDPGTGDDLTRAVEELTDPLWSVLSVFTVEYAIAQLLETRGITPTAMLGHSLGEWTAACLAGVIGLADVMRLVELRGRIFRRTEAGRMVSVIADASDIEPLLPAGCSIAAINGEGTCTIAGQEEAIDALEARLVADGVVCTRVPIAVAAHSPLLDPFLAEFEAAVRAATLREPTRPYLSCRTGTWVTPEQATDPAAWADQLRGTVRFADGLATLLARSGAVLLEVGPGATLANLARPALVAGQHVALASLDTQRGRRRGRDAFELALGGLWAAGIAVTGRVGRTEGDRRIALPTYPFERERHWIDRTDVAAVAATTARVDDLAQWTSRPALVERALITGAATMPTGAWLVLAGDHEVGTALGAHLRSLGAAVVEVRSGTALDLASDDALVLDPSEPEEWVKLLGEVEARHGHVAGVIHTWLVGPTADVDDAVDRGLMALVHLGQALAGSDSTPTIAVVTDELVAVGSDPTRSPERATVLGAVRVLPNELPGVRARLVDVDRDELGRPADRARLAAAVVAECLGGEEPVVALRGGQRLVETYERIELATPLQGDRWVRPGGTVVVTGGLNGVGRLVAGHLGDDHAHVVLIGRSGLPAPDLWDGWLRSHLSTNPVSARILAVRELEAAGARVDVVSADVTDRAALAAALAGVLAPDERVDLVVHAAGVLDDGPIVAKDRDSVVRVLAPKVAGTLALDAAIAPWRPRRFLAFSSTSAHLGLAGQVDYVGANAFLEAWARSPRRDDTEVLAVAWGVWHAVGMAARATAVVADVVPFDAGRPTGQPLLQRVLADDGDRVVLAGRWVPGDLWVLDEHRLADGTSVLPGASYPELLRAACEHVSGVAGAAITDLSLLRALEIPDGEHREVRVELRSAPRGWTASVRSLLGDTWVLHATGTVRPLRGAGIEASAPCVIEKTEPHPPAQAEHLRLGRRWANVRAVEPLGPGQVRAWLALDDDLVGDVGEMAIHPALVDAALGLAIGAAEARNPDLVYVPVALASVDAWAGVPSAVIADIEVVADDPANSLTASITLFDAEDRAVFTAEGIVVLGTDPGRLAAEPAHPVLEPEPRVVPDRLRRWEAAGIAPREGLAVFDLLAAAREPVLVVTPVPLDALRAELLVETASPGGADRARTGAVGGSGRAADNPVEEYLVEQWSELLGVPDVPVDVDFFALGGHSLLAARLVARVNKRFGAKLGLADLLAAGTVEEMARLVDPAGPVKEFTPLVALKPTGTSVPLFIVHGVGGNAGGYASMVRYLPEDRPLYALQAKGIVEGDEPFTTAEDQARFYLDHIRQIRPNGPYHLAGYSFGGLIAWEMARMLVADGQPVASLVLFDTDQPSNQMTPYGKVALHVHHARELGGRRGLEHLKTLVQRVAPTRGSGEADASAAAPNANLERGRDEWLDGVGLSAWQRRVREVNWTIFDRFVPKPYPGRVTLLRAEPGASGPRAADRGWGQHAGTLDIVQVRGTHESMLDPPNLVRTIGTWLAAVEHGERDPGDAR